MSIIAVDARETLNNLPVKSTGKILSAVVISFFWGDYGESMGFGIFEQRGIKRGDVTNYSTLNGIRCAIVSFTAVVDKKKI